MTSYYALAMGGSGSRCIESLIYLCAAGLGPSGKLTLVFVDPDRSNFSLSQSLRLAELYTALQRVKRGEGCAYCATEIEGSNPRSWSPFGDHQIEPTLGRFFQYDVMRNINPADADLFDVLYTYEQRQANLQVGFRGRPSIGAAIFGAKADPDHEEPWRALSSRISGESQGAEVRLFSFGSLFGGTGAAGLPTIPRMLCRRPDPVTGVLIARGTNIFTGASLLLPYFGLPSPPNLAQGEVYAHADQFLLNAREALRYYADCNPEFNRMYVIGADSPVMQKAFEIGGEKQANLPSYIELFAALGCRDFFQRQDLRGSEVAIIGRGDARSIVWSDLPESGTVRRALGQLTRTAFAYLKLFYPWLKELTSMEQNWYWNFPRRRAWYQDLFERRGVKVSDPEIQKSIEEHREFFVRYLCWLRDLHSGNGGHEGFRVNLADSSAFSKPESPDGLVDGKFGRLLDEGGGSSLESLLVRLADSPAAKAKGAHGFGYFQRALFEPVPPKTEHRGNKEIENDANSNSSPLA